MISLKLDFQQRNTAQHCVPLLHGSRSRVGVTVTSIGLLPLSIRAMTAARMAETMSTAALAPKVIT